MTKDRNYFVITAGSDYLDIDAYACCVAMKELLCLQGENAIAYSTAQTNYSVCDFLIKPGQIETRLSEDTNADTAKYVLVDVSDPNYIQKDIPQDRIVAVYDHHVGFEEYWKTRIGDSTHIEFIGAAATLVFREWKRAGLQMSMTQNTALLLIAAILDNTLNLTSSNTTAEDVEAFQELCSIAGVNENWRATYFTEVQKNIETDLKNALLNDVKYVSADMELPEYIGQIAVWSADSVFQKIASIEKCFSEKWQNWMLNVIDIEHHRGYFVCTDPAYYERISRLFGVSFTKEIAELPQPYLRKEIIKKAKENQNND